MEGGEGVGRGFLQQDGRRYSSFGSGRQIASFILNSHKAREPAFRSNEKVEINNAISYFHLKMKKWENCAARFFEAFSLSLFSTKNRTFVVSEKAVSFPFLRGFLVDFVRKREGGGVFLVGFIAAADAFLVGSLIQRAHSRYRDDRVRQRSLLVSREKSARLLPEGIPRNFALYSNSYRAARETLVFHASSTCMPPSLPSPLPLMRSQFRFAGINPSNWRKRPFDSIEHPSFHLAGKNETIRNVTNIVALYREIKLEIRRIPFLRSPRSSL